MYIVQSSPDNAGRREFYRAATPYMPTVKVGVTHDWDFQFTSYDVDREALLASGASRLGSSAWLNLSCVPGDSRPGVFTEKAWFGDLLAKLDA